MIKIAVSGKGGVGKTLLSSLLAKTFSEAGYSVIAIDADPDANLAATLGFPHPETITPISEMKELIEERTDTGAGRSSGYYKLNPKVDDIPENYSQKLNGIRLMVMGPLKRGGTGCYCPENSLLQALIAHVLLARDEVIILDMEAGIEHLGRGTSKAVDKLIVVVEPGRRSIETAHTIDNLAKDIGLSNVALVANKVRGQSDREFLISTLPEFEFLGFIPYDTKIIEADQSNASVLNASQPAIAEVKKIYETLVSGVQPLIKE